MDGKNRRMENNSKRKDVKMIEEYTTTLRLMFHFVLFTEAILCAYVFFKKLPIAKNLTNDGYLIVAKFGTVSIIVYSIIYAIFEADFIYGFFNIFYSDSYEIIAMFSQVLFTGLFISQNFAKE